MFKFLNFMSYSLCKRFHWMTSSGSTRFMSKDSKQFGVVKDKWTDKSTKHSILWETWVKILSNSLIVQTKIKVCNYFGVDCPINTVSLCKIIHVHKYLQNLTRDHFTVLSSSFPLVIYIVHTSKAQWYFTGLKSFGLSHKTISFPVECVILKEFFQPSTHLKNVKNFIFRSFPSGVEK